MAFPQKFTKKEPTPAATSPEPEAKSPVDPSLKVAHTIPSAGDIIKDIVTPPPQKDQDDPVLENHPTKDYDLAGNAARIDGKRQFQGDLLCRQLNCTMFAEAVHKMWGANPLGGAPVPVTYTREFMEKNILFDSFDEIPAERVLNYKRDLAHAHKYRYLYQYPSNPLTVAELEKQLKLEDAYMKSIK